MTYQVPTKFHPKEIAKQPINKLAATINFKFVFSNESKLLAANNCTKSSRNMTVATVRKIEIKVVTEISSFCNIDF